MLSLWCGVKIAYIATTLALQVREILTVTVNTHTFRWMVFVPTERNERCDMQEVWKPAKGYEGIYEVSNFGNVRNAKGMALKPFPIHQGYLVVDLSRSGKKRHHRVNRLVAETFIPNTGNKTEVNHKNGNKTDNRVSNLEWTTKSENMVHAYRSGLQTKGRYPIRRVICLEDGKVYDTCGEAARFYGLGDGAVSASCRRMSTRGKYNFRYLERKVEDG